MKPKIWIISLFGIFVFTLVICALKHNLFSSTRPSKAELISPNSPDSAICFGYESEWIAVKTVNQQEVIKILGFRNTKRCNWESGIKSAEDSGIFIMPVIDGWTIVSGWGLSYSGIANFKDSERSFDTLKNTLRALSKEFGEAQYFCTEHVTETHCWIKAIQDSIVRAYCYSGESGVNLIVEGIPTDFEKKYNLINTFSNEAKKDSNYLERKDILVPDEDFVIQIAANWSVDLTQLYAKKDLFGKFGLIANR